MQCFHSGLSFHAKVLQKYTDLRPLATAAFQTLVAKRRKHDADPDAPPRRPMFIDTCHAHASDSPEVKRRWPAFYTGPDRVS